MRIPKEQIPAKIDVPGAIARQAKNFGDATGFGNMAGEYLSLEVVMDFDDPSEKVVRRKTGMIETWDGTKANGLSE